MENCDDSGNSLPYIDDIPTDDESSSHPYNLRIFENYQQRNRDIEIINKYPEDASCKPLGPVAPLAEEADLSDDSRGPPKPKKNGMRLVIRGCNSSISIQALDNRSSITFKRAGRQHKVQRREEHKSGESEKPPEKSRKGRWKMLTRSLIAKSARFERRALEERYPKYVLLKNEEEDARPAKETYPKMFVFKEKNSERKKRRENMETKSEFNFKKSFKNKTKPLEGILAKEEDKGTKDPKQPFAGRSLDPSPFDAAPPQGQVFTEIQGIFEDTLNLCHGLKPPNLEFPGEPPGNSEEFYGSVPPQFPCQDPYCCFVARHPPPDYVPVYDDAGPRHAYKNPKAQTADASQPRHQEAALAAPAEEEMDLKNLPFGILSSFFPRVVIMKTFQAEELTKDEGPGGSPAETGASGAREEDAKPTETLEVPQPDLTIKSKMVQEVSKPEHEPVDQCQASENQSSDEEPRTKTDESEVTEYLHYCESEQLGNESGDRAQVSSPPPKYEGREGRKLPSLDRIAEEGGSSKDLSLTRIGYKMYDNLTRLSLNREKEITERAEAAGCGCTGNGTKKSPYNITLESSNAVVKVTVPENEVNFQILNPRGADVEVGVSGRSRRDLQEKKTVRRDELWHPDDGRKAVATAPDETAKGAQKLRVSLADDREVTLSIEMAERADREERKEKRTREKKIGTDDLELAGGDFVCTLGESHGSLSPRTGQLLKNLREKLQLGEKERRFLEEKVNEKLTDQKFRGKVLPGVFLLKQIAPGRNLPAKPSRGPPREKPKSEDGKDAGGRLREYYCEECLATMRIFEDQSPSVKSMVDKFETIIQLESY